MLLVQDIELVLKKDVYFKVKIVLFEVVPQNTEFASNPIEFFENSPRDNILAILPVILLYLQEDEATTLSIEVPMLSLK